MIIRLVLLGLILGPACSSGVQIDLNVEDVDAGERRTRLGAIPIGDDHADAIGTEEVAVIFDGSSTDGSPGSGDTAGMDVRRVLDVMPDIMPDMIVIREGLRGDYFTGNEFKGKTFATRYDPGIDFLWRTQAQAGKSGEDPVPGLSNLDFSVRWTGRLIPSLAGSYVFSVRYDDAVQVWIDGSLVAFHGYHDAHSPDTYQDSNPIALIAGRSYDIRVEFTNTGGDAFVSLDWSSTGLMLGRTPIPSSQFRSP